MPRVHGRTLEEARRYDLFKLAVAVLLFIAWLFFTDRVPTAPADPAGASSHADASAMVDALPSRLRIESVDGQIRLRGSVPDEATRNDYLVAARKALGRADRVEDGLLFGGYGGREGLGGGVDRDGAPLEGVQATRLRP